MAEAATKNATESSEEEVEDWDMSSQEDFLSEEDEPKDETELELERQVFGDDVAFKDEIRSFAQRDPFAGLIDADDSRDDVLATLDDADLFFLDAGQDRDPTTVQPSARGYEQADDQSPPPAWEDSDDERMMVSLMSVPRLRKLRNFEGEDVISGKESMRRLRRQFEALNPTPEWAKWAPPKKGSRKRQRGYEGSDSAESDSSAEEMDIGEPGLVAQPLSKLLQSNQAFTRPYNTSSRQIVKLRPEVVAIERMKDIPPTQPSAITSLSIHLHLPLLLSSGLSSTVYLHHINPHPVPPDAPNPLLTSLHLKNTPLATSIWSPLPTPQPSSTTLQHETHPKIYLSARRRYFHTWTLPTGTITKTTRIYGQQGTSPANMGSNSSGDNTANSMETLRPSPCGRYIAVQGTTRKGGGGTINILDAHTLQWVAAARVDGRNGIAAFAWWADGSGLCIATRGGEVSEWSVDERRVVWRWEDEGAVGITVIALGGGGHSAGADANTKAKAKAQAQAASNAAAAAGLALGPDRWVATGSKDGIVNIYERSAWRAALAAAPPPPSSSPLSLSPSPSSASASASASARPAPRATLTALTTPISALAFSPCGRLLVLASRWKRDALRLVYLPSSSAAPAAVSTAVTNTTSTSSGNPSTHQQRGGIGVYRNWPTAKTPLGRVSAVAVGEVDLDAGRGGATGGGGGDKHGDGDGQGERRIVLFVGNEAGVLRGWEIGG